MKTHTLTSDKLVATISLLGAELTSLKTSNGNELLWQADPKWWARHAPHLFPIVGRLQDDTLRHNGNSYTMTQHGFARDLTFTFEDTRQNTCSLVLRDNEITRQQYPFAFELRVNYFLQGDSLSITYAITNPGRDSLPVSIGAHPAFNWPIVPGSDRSDYSIHFERNETCGIRRLDNGLLKQKPLPSPIKDSILSLDDSLFEDDALILTDHVSRRLTYKGKSGTSIKLEFEDFPHLGIWSIPGAGFICIEPWQGHSSPVDYRGEYAGKPGIVIIPPTARRQWRMCIQITDD